MRTALDHRFGYFIVLSLALFAASSTEAAKKSKGPSLQTVENKTCGYYLRYPKGTQLEHPSDCVLTIPLKPKEKWISEASLTLYTAPVTQPTLGETPDGEPDPESIGTIKAGGMTFTKTIYMDAAMSHRMITLVYEGGGKYRKYRFEGRLTAVVPEVMDLQVKDWDPAKTAEKLFDGMVKEFRPIVPTAEP